MTNWKLYLGDALLLGAAALASAGRSLVGRPQARLVGDHEAGVHVLQLSEAAPRIVKGVRVVGQVSDEIRKVVGVQGRAVYLDSPTLEAHANGSEVRVLL